MNLPVKIRRDWHYYAFAIGLIFILNGVVGLLGFEAQGWQTYAVGLVTWVISFWLAGLIIRRRVEDDEVKDAQYLYQASSRVYILVFSALSAAWRSSASSIRRVIKSV